MDFKTGRIRSGKGESNTLQHTIQTPSKTKGDRIRQVPLEIKDQMFVIDQLNFLYPHPQSAFKEYITNAIDNAYPCKATRIDVYVDKNAGCIYIIDDGIGMTLDELANIPRSIGYSSKRGIDYMRGEKAFGMLAYPSVGANRIQVFSRKNDYTEDLYNYLRMDKGERLVTVEEISPSFLPLHEFDHGTCIALHGISPEKIDRYFTPTFIKQLIANTFSPLLREGVIESSVGWKSQRPRMLEVLAPEYRGEQILDDVIEISYMGKGKVEKKGIIELLLYVNPKGTNEKVSYFNKGVRVMDSIGKLDELSELPWKSGKLNGEINENFLTLIPSRESPIREGSRYAIFIQSLTEKENELNQSINKLKEESSKSEYLEFGNYLLRLMDGVYRELQENFSVLVRGKKGDLEELVTPLKQSGGLTTIGEGSRESETKKPGRDSLEKNPQGKSFPVKRARKVLSKHYKPSFERFNVEEEHMRSRLDEEYGLIRINVDHSEFVNSAEKKDKKIGQRYIASLFAKEVVQGEFNRNFKDGFLNPTDPNHIHLMTEVFMGMYQGIIREGGFE